jgi:hypothetical protein
MKNNKTQVWDHNERGGGAGGGGGGVYFVFTCNIIINVDLVILYCKSCFSFDTNVSQYHIGFGST